MDAATTTARPGPITGLRRFLGTRRGSIVVATTAAAIAAIALVAYLNAYKEDVRGGTLPTQVLVADRLIPKGTAGDVVATDRLFKPTTISEDRAEPAALPDASALAGKVAARDIFPGEQITAADFVLGGDQLRGRLTGDQRALAVPVDEAHGLIGSVRTGDRVDVLGSFAGSGGAGRGLLRTIAQGVLVLKAPSDVDEKERRRDQAVILRLSDKQAARLAYAADNGKIWFALRPPVGGRESTPATVTQGSVAGEVAR